MLTPAEVFELIPQKPPFRFVDRITALDAEHIVTEYTFRADESFYAGHFPSFPVTPGVILLEAMSQTAFALPIYLLSAEMPIAEIVKIVMMTTEASVELAHIVRPGDTVRMTARKSFWRKQKLKATVELTLADGTPAAQATVAGVGVARGG
jgi:3-hydroxyacyl-[acyl-carrier-protein] dehydratase